MAAPTRICASCEAYDWRQVGDYNEWICAQCGADPDEVTDSAAERLERERRSRALRGALQVLGRRRPRADIVMRFMVELKELPAEEWNAELLRFRAELDEQRRVAG